MQKQLFIKLFMLFLLFVGLQLPLALTQEIVQERSGYRDEAIAAVAQTQAAEQQVYGPVLVLPYKRSWTERVNDAQGQVETRVFSAQEVLHILPASLDVSGDLNVETRTRGIFNVPVFQNTVKFKGRFSWGANFDRPTRAGETIEWLPAQVIIGISQQRGLKQVSALQWQGQALPLQAGSLQADLLDGQGLHTNVELDAAAAQAEFSFELALNGTRRFALLPLAEQSRFNLVSNWPHPQYNGGQLPDTRAVTPQGFNAQWSSTHLATNLGSSWKSCITQKKCDAVWAQDFGISLLDPVDSYTLTQRALKYGFLFIGITFAAFFLFELRSGLRVHPIQYGLTGVALALFFLLLISLAEQAGFTLAFVCAAAVGIGLVHFYLSAVLRSGRRAGGFSALLALLYAALYGILHQEDAALLMGSLLLFTLLAVVMVLTRRIDWYQWGENTPS